MLVVILSNVVSVFIALVFLQGCAKKGEEPAGDAGRLRHAVGAPFGPAMFPRSGIIAQPLLKAVSMAPGANPYALPDPPADVIPYAPWQLRRAYGLHHPPATLLGAGQTISVVLAYCPPDILDSVAAFNERFGLPPAEVDIVDFTGSGMQHSGWDNECAIDIEWAHASRPEPGSGSWSREAPTWAT